MISWDNYPAYNTLPSQIAMKHDLMRGLKDQPFLIMEQTPSQQNWQRYNTLKRPGQMRAMSYQGIAHGADSVQYFQLRRSVGGCEKFHGAVIAHVGTEGTRVFGEVAQLGKELESFGTATLGSEKHSQVGILFDWENYWALEYTSGPCADLKYVPQIQQYYDYFYSRNISVDMLPVDADFSGYRIICAPVLYMIRGSMKQSLEAFVKNGGILILTYMSGIVGPSDNVYLGGYPGPLREMAGIWVEEIDSLPPEFCNDVKLSDGSHFACNLVYDQIHLEGAEALAEYTKDFYANTPAVTRNRFGEGSVYYVGTQIEADGLARILDQATAEGRVDSLVPEASELEISCRESQDTRFYYLINFSGKDQPLPASLAGKKDLITGRVSTAEDILKPWDVCILTEAL